MLSRKDVSFWDPLACCFGFLSLSGCRSLITRRVLFFPPTPPLYKVITQYTYHTSYTDPNNTEHTQHDTESNVFTITSETVPQIPNRHGDKGWPTLPKTPPLISTRTIYYCPRNSPHPKLPFSSPNALYRHIPFPYTHSTTCIPILFISYPLINTQYTSIAGIPLHEQEKYVTQPSRCPVPIKFSQTTIFYSHGNAADIGMIYHFLYELSKRLQVNVFCYDYAGYGHSDHKASPFYLLRSGERALDYLLSNFIDRTKRVILYGQSLGTAVTCHLAHKHCRFDDDSTPILKEYVSNGVGGNQQQQQQQQPSEPQQAGNDDDIPHGDTTTKHEQTHSISRKQEDLGQTSSIETLTVAPSPPLDIRSDDMRSEYPSSTSYSQSHGHGKECYTSRQNLTTDEAIPPSMNENENENNEDDVNAVDRAIDEDRQSDPLQPTCSSPELVLAISPPTVTLSRGMSLGSTASTPMAPYPSQEAQNHSANRIKDLGHRDGIDDNDAYDRDFLSTHGLVEQNPLNENGSSHGRDGDDARRGRMGSIDAMYLNSNDQRAKATRLSDGYRHHAHTQSYGELQLPRTQPTTTRRLSPRHGREDHGAKSSSGRFEPYPYHSKDQEPSQSNDYINDHVDGDDPLSDTVESRRRTPTLTGGSIDVSSSPPSPSISAYGQQEQKQQQQAPPQPAGVVPSPLPTAEQPPKDKLFYRNPSNNDRIKGVILHSPMSSIFGCVRKFDITQKRFFYDLFENARLVPVISCPILLIHGCNDESVPISHSKTLLERAFFTVPPFFAHEASHNDVETMYTKEYYMHLHRFLAMLRRDKWIKHRYDPHHFERPLPVDIVRSYMGRNHHDLPQGEESHGCSPLTHGGSLSNTAPSPSLSTAHSGEVSTPEGGIENVVIPQPRYPCCGAVFSQQYDLQDPNVTSPLPSSHSHANANRHAGDPQHLSKTPSKQHTSHLHGGKSLRPSSRNRSTNSGAKRGPHNTSVTRSQVYGGCERDDPSSSSRSADPQHSIETDNSESHTGAHRHLHRVDSIEMISLRHPHQQPRRRSTIGSAHSLDIDSTNTPHHDLLLEQLSYLEDSQIARGDDGNDLNSHYGSDDSPTVPDININSTTPSSKRVSPLPPKLPRIKTLPGQMVMDD